MRLGLVFLLSLAVCAAQTSHSDVYFPAPYFGEGENLSSNNCGIEASQNQSAVFVKNIRAEIYCEPFIAISQTTILGLERCSFHKGFSSDLRVFPHYCHKRTTEEDCIRISFKVLDVIDMAVNPTADVKFKIMITEKMPSVVTPICLFNRDNVMDLQLQRESPYFQWSTWPRAPTMQVNVTGQSNCSSTELRNAVEDYKSPIQNILCVKEIEIGYNFLANFYKGRYFLRGVKYFWNRYFYLDLLPLMDEIARHAQDISVLHPIPPTKQPRGFPTPDNLSFPNCGRKPSTRRKRGNDDSSERLILMITNCTFDEIVIAQQTYPWHAYIENAVTGETCGGTLISPTVVLTAAHCLNESEAEDFRVTLGMRDKRQRRTRGVQRRKLSSLIVHPKYDPAEFISDVGLLILKKKVKITDYVQPICLWNDDSDSNLVRVAGTKAMVVGFGLADNHSRQDELQEVRLPILAHKECYLSERRFFGKYLRPGDNFCAGNMNGTTTCNGDSGDSLSVEKDGRWFIRGIVSSGISRKVMIDGEERSLCHPNQYSLFTDVASYMDWIVENTPEISFRN